MPIARRIGFKVSEEGRAFLHGLHNRIGIISVAGKYRTGKSFLLNRIIMGKLKGGFGVGSTINACTKVRRHRIFNSRRASGCGVSPSRSN